MKNRREAILKTGSSQFIGMAFLGAAVLAVVSFGAWSLLSYGATLPVRSPREAALGTFVVAGAGLFAGVGAIALAAGGVYHTAVRFRTRGDSDV